MFESSIPMSHWANDDKPREKLCQKGPQALSDAELIAIILGTGDRRLSALTLGRQLLAKADNSLHALGAMSLQQLTQFKGIGETKAVRILAAVEMGKRRAMAEVPSKTALQSSKLVFQLMRPLLSDLAHEEFWVLYMNNSNQMLYKQQLSKGGITGTVVDVRLLFKKALEVSAVALILCHNHPSGKLVPSDADMQITRRIIAAGQELDIKVLDHLIIASGGGYLSFADEGLL